ncbi:MAG: hypothetical protein KGD73_04875, partial [Candidatus Lokiarchaeota archaeon]|nr:hypothetical protein [Candidatus Lokiarchaeota archaeon]
SIRTRKIYPLLKQLDADCGVLFAPIGEDRIQTYTQILRDSDQYIAEDQLQVKFTPLITQVEIDEFKLVTDYEVLEQNDNENEESEDSNISLKYRTDIFDETARKSEFSGKPSEIKPIKIYIAFLEFINLSIERLKHDNGLKNWVNSIENFNLVLQLINGSKNKVKFNFGDMEKSLKQLQNLNKSWLDLERENNYEESFKTKKLKILQEHLLELGNFQKAIHRQLKKLN